MRRLALGIAMGWICAAEAAGQASPSCPAYTASPIYRPRLRQVQANPSNWIGLIEGALDGDEILLADGVYNLSQYAVQITKQITVRGASGNRAAVRVQGQGYGVGGEGFMIHGQNVTIADLTITAIRNHAISIKGESGAEAPHVYNVHLYDIGTQHIKGTPGDGVGNGVVACSRLGYTPGGVRGDYINAIDIHRGIDWIVRDNEIYNVWGDGTGCEVDVIQAGAYPGAVEIWQSQNVPVRNNLIGKPVWDRGGNTGLSLQGNKTDGTTADLGVPFDPHLAAASGAVDFAGTVSLTGVPDDIDGDARPQGPRRDAGCDEWKPCATPPGNLDFFTLVPCRLVDTRLAPGPLGGPALASGATRTFDLNQSCAVPPTAKALSLNIAVAGPTGNGYVTVGPGGCPAPAVSTINFSPGQTRANNAIATLAADGSGNLIAFAVVAGGGSVDLILDVNGYFE